MSVPYFSKEDNLTAFRKMKIIFLIKRIRDVDFLILMTWIFPFLLNLIVFHLIKGENGVDKMFYPFGSIFKTNASMEDWSTWFGSIHGCTLIITVLARVLLSHRLWKRMKQYKKEKPSFEWKVKDKFWLMVCLPFISFVIYPILLKLNRFELVHKYNL